MASFDFVDVAAKGYEFVWKHRGYLARIAFPVVFTKIACYLTIFLMAAQENILRKELILMPAYFVEAVFLTGLVRFALFREPILMIGSMARPRSPHNQPFAEYDKHLSHNQCIQAGVICYLLFRIVWALWLWMNSLIPVDQDPEAVHRYPPTFLNVIVVLTVLGCILWILLWFVRLAWTFVAVAQGHPILGYLKAVRPVKIPVSLAGAMLLCFIPLDILFENIKLGALSLFEGRMALKILSASILESAGETLIMAICTVAVGHAVHLLLEPKDKGKT